MISQTTDRIDNEAHDRGAYITFIVRRRQIKIHTNLTCTNQLSDSISIKAHWHLMLGRSNNSAILLHDSTVSRLHLFLGYNPHKGFYIMDAKSHNGTFLNQERLLYLQRYPLKNGDYVTVASQKIRINIVHKDRNFVYDIFRAYH